MNKAYDRADWNYLLMVMLKLGFHETWAGWIKMCIESVSYSVIVNKESVGPIFSGRGLRQGDSLSPTFLSFVLRG